jgi:hypothetical protein
MKELAALRGTLIGIGGADCPDGWVLCDDVCAPSCEMFAAAPEKQP